VEGKKGKYRIDIFSQRYLDHKVIFYKSFFFIFLLFSSCLSFVLFLFILKKEREGEKLKWGEFVTSFILFFVLFSQVVPRKEKTDGGYFWTRKGEKENSQVDSHDAQDRSSFETILKVTWQYFKRQT